MNFLISDEEKEKLLYVCKALHTTQSSFIRRAFLKQIQEELYFLNKNSIKNEVTAV